MTNHSTETRPLVYARVAGLLYLTVAVLGGFSFFFGQSFIVPGDAATTAHNIMASEGLFRLGFVGGLIAQTIQILLVLVLYKLLKSVNKTHALLMVILSLVGIPIAMLNLLNQFAALLLLSGADYLTLFESNQLHAQVMFFLDLHSHGINIAQIFWGLWLLPLGYLVFKSGFLPSVLGILLIVGGFGYVIDFVTFSLFPNFNMTISQFTFIGELLLPLWLLIKGVNVEQWGKRSFVLETA
ncbi:MAG: DUF4386 domain-containing protein [Chloroflexi bacterium]|nr:DUF4386 domain-containing protein [Chloroflexota bacterium]